VFRATGITAYLGTLENAQAMRRTKARTAKLYDRTVDEITLDKVVVDPDLVWKLRTTEVVV
jgi:hypothetical protein